SGAERGHDSVVPDASGKGLERNGELARVNPQARQGTAGPERAQRLLKRALQTERFDGHIYPAPASDQTHSLENVVCGIEDNVGAQGSGQLCSGRIAFYGDDQAGTPELGTHGGAQADGTLGKNGDRVAERDLPILSSGKACGSYVGQKDDLLVGKLVGNFGQIGLGERNQQEFRLGAVNRVPEPPSAHRSPAALRQRTSQAEPALTARGNGTDKHAVARLITGNPSPQLLDHPDGFVSKDEAGSDGILAVQNVHIGSAYGGQSDTNECFAEARLRHGNGFHCDLLRAAKHQGAHGAPGMALPRGCIRKQLCGGIHGVPPLQLARPAGKWARWFDQEYSKSCCDSAKPAARALPLGQPDPRIGKHYGSTFYVQARLDPER